MELAIIVLAVLVFISALIVRNGMKDDDVRRNGLKAIKDELADLRQPLYHIKNEIGAGRMLIDRITEKVCPAPQPEPTTEEKVEVVGKGLAELENRIFEYLKRAEDRERSRWADAKAPAAELKASPIASPATDTLTLARLAQLEKLTGGIAESTKSVADATTANTQALGWLVSFVKKANPQAAEAA